MLASDQVEELICALATWDQQTLIDQFVSFESRFPVDMTADFLSTLSVDRIRHVFLALCLQNQRSPIGAKISA